MDTLSPYRVYNNDTRQSVSKQKSTVKEIYIHEMPKKDFNPLKTKVFET